MTQIRKPGRPAVPGDYKIHFSHYENEQGRSLLHELAAKRGGVSMTALLRQLTREEAARLGLKERAG